MGAADPIGVHGRLRKLRGIDVAPARYAMDMGSVLLGLGGTVQGLPFTFGESFFSFHRRRL